MRSEQAGRGVTGGPGVASLQPAAVGRWRPRRPGSLRPPTGALWYERVTGQSQSHGHRMSQRVTVGGFRVQDHNHSDKVAGAQPQGTGTGAETQTQTQEQRHRHRNRDTGTGTETQTQEQRHIHRNRDTDTGTETQAQE